MKQTSAPKASSASRKNSRKKTTEEKETAGAKREKAAPKAKSKAKAKSGAKKDAAGPAGKEKVSRKNSAETPEAASASTTTGKKPRARKSAGSAKGSKKALGGKSADGTALAPEADGAKAESEAPKASAKKAPAKKAPAKKATAGKTAATKKRAVGKQAVAPEEPGQAVETAPSAERVAEKVTKKAAAPKSGTTRKSGAEGAKAKSKTGAKAAETAAKASSHAPAAAGELNVSPEPESGSAEPAASPKAKKSAVRRQGRTIKETQVTGTVPETEAPAAETGPQDPAGHTPTQMEQAPRQSGAVPIIDAHAGAAGELTLRELSDSMQLAARQAGWTKLMPVQARSIPYFLARRDLMVQSHTGSGKTGAFLLPIIDRIDPELAQCQALILVPTRELALQVSREAEILSNNSSVRTIAVYGGVGYRAQMTAFREGAHIVIGTPGRILDHLLKRSLSVANLETLVFDEADRLLSMGFYQDMKRLRGFLPRRAINTYMFSATYPYMVRELANDFMHKPEMLSLSTEQVHAITTEHVYYRVPEMEKDRALVRILEIENPDSAIIFCNTKSQVNYVAVILQRFGFDADALSSELSQRDRERVLARVREGSLRFLVATDVAGRGIDIPNLSHAIQYEPPEDQEAYIHRAGRTGRAGASGVAINLVDFREQMKLERIARRYNIDLHQRELPGDKDVQAVVAERLTVMLEARIRTLDQVQTERLQRFVSLAVDLGSGEEKQPELLAMLMEDYYQYMMHAPPIRPERKDTQPSGEVREESDPPAQQQGGGKRRRSGRRRGGRRR